MASSMASASNPNIYRIGDYVYFEINQTQPYAIRKIEELKKMPNGGVEARVSIFYRRRDLPHSLSSSADKYAATYFADEAFDEQEADGSTGSQAEGGEARASAVLARIPTATLTASSQSQSQSIPDMSSSTGAATGSEDEGVKERAREIERLRHQIKQRELYFLRHPPPHAAENHPVIFIRGKCHVQMLNELETPLTYLHKEDLFFYTFNYDPNSKTLSTDRSEIKVGPKHQATIPQLITASSLTSTSSTLTAGSIIDVSSGVGSLSGSSSVNSSASQACVSPWSDLSMPRTVRPLAESDPRQNEQLETLQWSPYAFDTAYHSSSAFGTKSLFGGGVSMERVLEQYLTIVRSIATWARVVDPNSAVRHSTTQSCAAAACRDITSMNAIEVLHACGYDLNAAIAHIAPQGGAIQVRDQLEEWSIAEANFFEVAIDNYGKDFVQIKNEVLKWKTMRSIIEYYYMWKTTDRYIAQKRIKAQEAEKKLLEVYVPPSNRPSGNMLPPAKKADPALRPCEGCSTSQSNEWFAWPFSNQPLRVCGTCWAHYKKYADLPQPIRSATERAHPSLRPERLAAQQAAIQKQAARSFKCPTEKCGKEFAGDDKLGFLHHLAYVHPVRGAQLNTLLGAWRGRTPANQMSQTNFHAGSAARISRRICATVNRPLPTSGLGAADTKKPDSTTGALDLTVQPSSDSASGAAVPPLAMRALARYPHRILRSDTFKQFCQAIAMPEITKICAHLSALKTRFENRTEIPRSVRQTRFQNLLEKLILRANTPSKSNGNAMEVDGAQNASTATHTHSYHTRSAAAHAGTNRASLQITRSPSGTGRKRPFPTKESLPSTTNSNSNSTSPSIPTTNPGSASTKSSTPISSSSTSNELISSTYSQSNGTDSKVVREKTPLHSHHATPNHSPNMPAGINSSGPKTLVAATNTNGITDSSAPELKRLRLGTPFASLSIRDLHRVMGSRDRLLEYYSPDSKMQLNAPPTNPAQGEQAMAGEYVFLADTPVRDSRSLFHSRSQLRRLARRPFVALTAQASGAVERNGTKAREEAATKPSNTQSPIKSLFSRSGLPGERSPAAKSDPSARKMLLNGHATSPMQVDEGEAVDGLILAPTATFPQ